MHLMNFLEGKQRRRGRCDDPFVLIPYAHAAIWLDSNAKAPEISLSINRRWNEKSDQKSCALQRITRAMSKTGSVCLAAAAATAALWLLRRRRCKAFPPAKAVEETG